MDDLLEDFIAETRETLEKLSAQLVEWEQNPADLALIDSAFRFVHTVKGSCGFLDLPRLLRLSHAAEDVLSSARSGALAASPALVSSVLLVIDRIAALTDALETGQAVYDNDDDLIDAMLAFIPRTQDADELHISAEPDGGVLEPADIGEENSTRTQARSVRVSLALLDKLMSGVSDMVLARNEVSRQLRRVGANSDLENAFARLSTSVAEMRDAVGLMRMQHIDRLFSSLPRLLRDICQDLGKDIDLRIEGSEVEVDREMIEALRDPLTHILRNAADHGIESVAERVEAGKPTVGHIRICARQSGNQILIEVADDGRGINVEKLGARAVAAKLYTAAEWQKLPEKTQLNMVFTPGLSTADQVSAISGRGVGMDVVKTNIQAIGGTIDIENFEGLGVKMTLRLPLTLSIIAGLSVRAGGQVFGISRNSVVEILSASNANVVIERLGSASVASIRGKRFPHAKLEDILGIDEVAGNGESRTLIVVRPAVGSTFVLDVAAVIDNEELVVKPGAQLVMETGLYAGTSLPDNGRPMLLLDATGLASRIGVAGDVPEEEIASENSGQGPSEKRPAALLFVGMDGMKRAIRVAAIDRMQDVAVEQVRYTGGKMRVDLDEGLFDIHDLTRIPEEGFVKLLRLTDGQSSIFLAVADVIDIFRLDEELAASADPARFEGVTRAFGDVVELINVFQFFEAGVEAHTHSGRKALCYVESNSGDEWESRILAPLLTACGYAVSFEPADRDRADIILNRNADMTDDDPRIVMLRDNGHARVGEAPSIYRYDRVGLISAIESKLAGAA